MTKRMMKVNIKLTRGKLPMIDRSINYDELELLPPQSSVLVLKEYLFLLEAKWNKLGQTNNKISRALERCRKIEQMEKQLTTARESLYFLMYAEDVKILIAATHYMPFDQKYLKVTPKGTRSVNAKTYYEELKQEIKQLEIEETSSIDPVKKLGTKS